MPRYSDYTRFTDNGNYEVGIAFSYLEQWVEEQSNMIDVDPVYQRGHVWTQSQQSRFVEYLLRGGRQGRLICWNNPHYEFRDERSKLADRLELVDGKQRLTACLRYLRNEIAAFGHYRRDYTDANDIRNAFGPTGAGLVMNVNSLRTHAAVLRWYIDLNDGGTPHSEDEIARVRALLQQESA